jgi:subtilase family serine protease
MLHDINPCGSSNMKLHAYLSAVSVLAIALFSPNTYGKAPSPQDYTPGWHNWHPGYGDPSNDADAHDAPEFLDNGAILVPDTSLEYEGDAGVTHHTNHTILFLAASTTSAPSGETPASIRSIYQLPTSGGGSGTIVIVDAYDYPTALNDFNVFSNTFGLPVETSTNATASTNKVFQVVYANATTSQNSVGPNNRFGAPNQNSGKPVADGGWSQEAALDIEWAHAMAPNAKIVLMEANSSSASDLYNAVTAASRIAGVKEISMSWGSSESRTETRNDSYFQQSGIVYFAASGDTGGNVIYPGCSPYVVSAGGTTLNFTNGAFASETGWSGSGGGKSAFEAIPAYQSALKSKLGQFRGVPDYSFVANPYSGVSVYDSTPYNGMSGWMVFGGTSVSAPSLAGIVNSAATSSSSFAASSTAELTKIYKNLGSSYFRDITSGTAGCYSCTVGWDFVTGIGSTIGLLGK